MKVSDAIEKMIDFYNGDLHDIYHFLKVWAFAKSIGEQEVLDARTQETLELAAVVHDISCPLCREKIRRYQREASGAGERTACESIFRGR